MDKEIKILCVDKDEVSINTALALRYLRVRREIDEQMQEVFDSCVREFTDAAQYKACYRYFDITIKGKTVRFDDVFELESEKLVRNLSGCSGAFVFVATTSLAVDRLIKKHSSLRLSRAVVIDAVASAAVEGLCDLLCDKLKNEYKVDFRPRFSPGYGDLSIACQSEVLSACEATRKIGVTLNSSFMMIPSKSVSAVVGVRPKNESCDKALDCSNCDSTQCQYRE